MKNYLRRFLARSTPRPKRIPAADRKRKLPYRPALESLESRLAPAGAWYAIGAGVGGGPDVKVYDSNHQLLYSFFAYDPNFTGGVNVAMANDGTHNVIVTTPGPGGGPEVHVYDGSNGKLLNSFLAYDRSFTGGLSVAAADLVGDGNAEIVVGAGQGSVTQVKIFDLSGNLLSSFDPFPGFTGGVDVAVHDFGHRHRTDIVTAAGPGGGPQVKVFAGDTQTFESSFFAYDPAFTGGVSVAAGDVYGLNTTNIVTGAGPGGGPQVRVFDTTGQRLLTSFFAFDPNFTGGVNVSVAVLNGDDNPSIVAAAGPGGGPDVGIWQDPDGSFSRVRGQFAFDPQFTGGASVAGNAAATNPSFQPGHVLKGSQLPGDYQTYDVFAKYQTTDHKNQDIPYVPPSFALSPTDTVGNVTGPPVVVPYTVNGSTRFKQPVQSNDWWSNLMFRLDPAVHSGLFFKYNNTPFISDPQWMSFVNDVTGGSNRNGLAIYRPTAPVLDNITQAGPYGNYANNGYGSGFRSDVTVGIGVDNSTNVASVSFVDNPLKPGTAPHDDQLNVRVNKYSDWGVEVAYGDDNANDPSSSTNALTITMLNGSPFTYFQKTGSDLAKLWLQGTARPGIAEDTIATWDPGLGPNVIGASLTDWIPSPLGGGAGATFVNNTANFIIIAPAGTTWIKQSGNTQIPNLFTNTMTNGLIVVAALPDTVNGVALNPQSNLAGAQAVAKIFAQYAGNVPVNTSVNDPTNSGVADFTPHQQTYDGQNVTFGFDPSTNVVRSLFTVTTANQQPTLQVLYPTQSKNLFGADRSNLTINGSTFGYYTQWGAGNLYLGNSFATQLTNYGTLPYMSLIADQTNASVAQSELSALVAWYQTYVQDPTRAFPLNPSVYEPGYFNLSQTMIAADQLSQSTSQLSAADRQTAAGIRDRLLRDLEHSLANWFETDTGAVMQLNTQFDSLFGYLGSNGSDSNLNDHHFGWSYFLDAFAAVGTFDTDFVRSYLPQVAQIIDDVANTDRNNASYPFLRNFNPYAGHSWADGLGQGGNNEESTSEAINFAWGLWQLGELTGNAAWADTGMYMYTTEIDAVQQYWFNTPGFNTAGDTSSNWPQSFYVNQDPATKAQQPYLNTQLVANFQYRMGRKLFFGPNQMAAYAIEWLPIGGNALYLGRDPNDNNQQDYQKANWNRFLVDLPQDTKPDIYGAALAAYQSLVPSNGGSGITDPGAAGGLARLAQYVQDAKGGSPVLSYGGSSAFLAQHFIDEMNVLGTVNSAVVATTAAGGSADNYSVFDNGANRTYTAYNPYGTPVTITFTDPLNNNQQWTMTVPPWVVLSQVVNTTTNQLQNSYRYEGMTASKTSGTPLFLRGSNTLSQVPGDQVPDPNADYSTPSLTPYAKTFLTVAARPTNAGDDPGAAFKQVFTSSFSGTFTGDPTSFDLFLNQYQTPAVNVNFNNLSVSNSGVITITYDFGNGTQRVETYQMNIGARTFNGYWDYNTLLGPAFLAIKTDNGVAFPQTVTNGKVTVQFWEGPWAANDPMSNRGFAVSVDTPTVMGRASEITVPYQ